MRNPFTKLMEDALVDNVYFDRSFGNYLRPYKRVNGGIRMQIFDSRGDFVRYDTFSYEQLFSSVSLEAIPIMEWKADSSKWKISSESKLGRILAGEQINYPDVNVLMGIKPESQRERMVRRFQ